MDKIKRTNNDLQNIHIKLKIEQHEPHYKPGVNSGAPEGKAVTSGTGRVNLSYWIFLFFSNIFTWQTYNALFIIRSLCKYFVEHLSEELVLQQFEARPPNMDGKSSVLPLLHIQSSLCIYRPLKWTWKSALYIQVKIICPIFSWGKWGSPL
jgi:hypothetical protein